MSAWVGVVGRTASALLVSALAVLSTRAAAQSTGRPFPVCITGDTPPLALDSATSGFEVDLARAIARAVGRTLVVVPIEPDDGPSGESALAARQCDVVMGVTIDSANPPAAGIRLTRPYYRAGFVVVRRRDTAVPAARLADGERFGVDRAAEQVIYPLRQAGVPLAIAPSGEEVIDRVRRGRLRYGLLWGPWAAWTLRETVRDSTTRDLTLDAAPPLPPGTGPWAFGIGLRAGSVSGDAALFDAVDRAVATLVADGTVRRLLADYRLTCCVAPP